MDNDSTYEKVERDFEDRIKELQLEIHMIQGQIKAIREQEERTLRLMRASKK